MQPSQAEAANAASTIFNWVTVLAALGLAAFGLKKTHDVGQDKRKVDDAAARTKAWSQERLGKDQAAAQTRAANALENTRKGAEVVSERAKGVVSTIFSVSRQACEEVKGVVDEKRVSDIKIP